MDDLRELTKKIKENTASKKEEKQNDPEVKNLFENIFGSNSIGYLNPFLNKKDDKNDAEEVKRKEEEDSKKEENNAKLEENKTESGRNKKRNEEFFKSMGANKYKKDTEEKVEEGEAISHFLLKLKEELNKGINKNKEKYLENELKEREKRFHIDIRKILRGKKDVKLKDFNKIIEAFDEEIMRKKTELENFIYINKNKTECEEKFHVLENVTTRIKSLEKSLQIKDDVYELYLIKKIKKRKYDSLVFFKKFFNCLKNTIYFLEEAECCYKKLKLLESLEHLKNCKTHMVLVKCLLKYVKENFPENENENSVAEVELEMKGNCDEQIKKQNFKDVSLNISEINMNSKNGQDTNKNCNSMGNNKNDMNFPFNNSSLRKEDVDIDVEFLEKLKKMFYTELGAEEIDEKTFFFKTLKIKYDNILNNLKEAAEIIFEKMFIFNKDIIINRRVYLKKSDLIPGESDDITEITFGTFWKFVYQLKEGNKYLKDIKTNMFFHCFKLMTLFYCIVKNKTREEMAAIFSDIFDVEHMNCLTYRLVKTSVADILRKKKLPANLMHPSIYFKEYDFIFRYPTESYIKNVHDKSQKIEDFYYFRLTDYISEEENSARMHIERLYKKLFYFFNSSEKIGNIDENRIFNERCENMFNDFCRCLFDFCSFTEIFFFINEDKQKYFDFQINKNIYTDELLEAFSFYFKHKKVNQENTMYFCKSEKHCEDSSKLRNIKKKMEEKYQSVKMNKQGKKKDVSYLEEEEKFNYYQLNELSNYVYYFLHRMNLKRKNLRNIEKIYFLYLWKNESNVFYTLVKHVMEYNFLSYLNYSYSILSQTFHYFNANEYIIINENIDEYIFNSYFEHDNNGNDSETQYEKTNDEILNYIEEQQDSLKTNIKEKIERNILQKNHLEKHILSKNTNKVNTKNDVNKTKNEYTTTPISSNECLQEKQDDLDFNNTSDQMMKEEEEQHLHGTEKNLHMRINKMNMNVITKHNNLSYIQIHKYILYIVFIIYEIVFCSYKILMEIRKEMGEDENKEIDLTVDSLNDISEKNKDSNYNTDRNNVKTELEDSNGNYSTKEDLTKEKFLVNENSQINDANTQAEMEMKAYKESMHRNNVIRINICLLAYKIIKYIYNLFLSYSFCIFHFLYFSPLKCDTSDHLMSVINDNVFLKKVLENINQLYLKRKHLFYISIKEEYILINNVDFYSHFKSFHSTPFFEENSIKHYFLSENKLESDSSNSSSPEIVKKLHKNMKSENIEKKEENGKRKFFIIDKIGFLKKVYFLIDKFHLSLNKFTKYYTKINKRKLAVLLKKENMLTEDCFLINTSKILSIIFDFFQVQILSESIHKQVILGTIDYFFYLINRHICDFVLQKKNITENERLQLYEIFIFIQNNLYFILRSYKKGRIEDENEIPCDENYFLKNFNKMYVNLLNMKKNRILFLLLFCKIKYILNAKKSILSFIDAKDIETYLMNNPHVCDDENFDAIVNEFS